jgi:hypothetical protein
MLKYLKMEVGTNLQVLGETMMHMVMQQPQQDGSFIGMWGEEGGGRRERVSKGKLYIDF